MDKKQAQHLTKEIQEALALIGKCYNVDITLGNVTFDNIEFHTKLTCKSREVNGKTAEQLEFEKYAPLFGFGPEDYGKLAKKPVNGGKCFKLIGFKPSAPKYALMAVDTVTGLVYALATTSDLWDRKTKDYVLNLTPAPSKREEVL